MSQVTLYLSSYNYPFLGLSNVCIGLLDLFSRLLITVINFGRFIGIQSVELYFVSFPTGTCPVKWRTLFSVSWLKLAYFLWLLTSYFFGRFWIKAPFCFILLHQSPFNLIFICFLNLFIFLKWFNFAGTQKHFLSGELRYSLFCWCFIMSYSLAAESWVSN